MNHEPITLTPHAGDNFRDVYWGTRTKFERWIKKNYQAVAIWLTGTTASLLVGLTWVYQMNGGF